MGRKRKHNPLDLPDRVYAKHGAFYYCHRDGRWERIGTDVSEARRVGKHYNDPGQDYGTVSYWYDEFLLHCKGRIGKPRTLKGIAQRTYDDYADAAEPLKAFFGKMMPSRVEGHQVGQYLDLGVENERPVRANREKAALSACFTWLIRQPTAGVKANPCFGVTRNPEWKRERYVEHHEYRLIYDRVAQSIRALMDIMYRTLQRPEDIIIWRPSTVLEKREPDGSIGRVLSIRQQKTDAPLNIRVDGDLEAIITSLLPEKDEINQDKTLIRTRAGQPYTYDGLSSMFRRVVADAVKDGDLKESFTLYDIKGKGATDMWLSGEKLERIQLLCGHDSITTTERYVKCRWRGTISSNSTQILESNIPTGFQ